MLYFSFFKGRSLQLRDYFSGNDPMHSAVPDFFNLYVDKRSY